MPSLQQLLQDDSIDVQQCLCDLTDNKIKQLNINLLDRAKVFAKVTFAKSAGG